MAQSSCTSPQHASFFSGQLEVVVEHNLISPPSTAHDGQSEATAGQLFNCTAADSPKMAVSAASDYELDSDAKENNRGKSLRPLV